MSDASDPDLKPEPQPSLWDTQGGNRDDKRSGSTALPKTAAPTVGSTPRAKAIPAAGKQKVVTKTGTKRKPTVADSARPAKKVTRRPSTRRPFPQLTLEEALAVPQFIKEKNNGKPFETEDLAKACKATRMGDKFFYLAGSSRDYSLTTGSRDTDVISMTDLGNSIVYPESAEQQRQHKITAFYTVKLFKDVFDHYGGSGTLPEVEFVSNVLFKKFNLDPSLHQAFYDLYKKNCEYLSLTDAKSSLEVVKREGGGDEAVVLRQPGEYTRTAFVIMPFSEKTNPPRPSGLFAEVLNSLIKPASNAADFGVETAHAHGSDLIHHTIIRQLVEADLVVADLTDHNPNVLFELGIRIALDRPVLLIRAKGTPPIFDVDNMMRVCEYDPRLWRTTIVDDLASMTDHLKGAWEKRDKNPSYIGILKTGQQVGPSTTVAQGKG